MNTLSLRHKIFLPIIPITIACALFFYRFGFQTLDVTNINWLILHEDLATHYLGWLFFRNEPWAFPLGKISGFMYPIGTNIVLTDSNPLVAIPLKLVSFLIPMDFQFIGIWLLVCSCLQGYWGYRLMTTMTRDPLFTVFGSIFFVISPPILYRMMTGHDTLCAHWIILAALFFYFRINEQTSTGKLIAKWAILVAVGALVHLYMNFMVLVLAMAFSVSYFGVDLKNKVAPFLFSLLLYPLELLLIFWVVGPLGVTGLCYGENGYGEYSMNLNSFWNSMGFSAFLNGLPLGPKQYEGFNYIGLGTMILIVSAIGTLIIVDHPKISFHRKRICFFIPLLLALSGFLLLAVSNKISYGSSSITLFSIPQFLEMPFGVFRASGRFSWPIYYAILYAGLYVLASQVTRRYAISILTICLIVQVADLRPLLSHGFAGVPKTFATPLKDPFWENAYSRFDKILVFPPFLKNIIANGDYKYLALYAAKHGMAIDTGYVARSQDKPMTEYRKLLEDQISGGQMDPRSLYVVSSFPEIHQLSHGGYHCYNVDGYNLCVPQPISSESGKLLSCTEATLDDFLTIYRLKTIILVIAQEAYSNFSEKVKEYLRERGCKIDQLVFGDYYICAIIDGKVCKEVTEKDKTRSVTFHQGDLCGKALRTDIRIWPKGQSASELTTIECGGIEWAKNKYGINAIVVNENGSVFLTSSSDAQFPDRVFLVSPAEETEKSQ